MTDTIFLFGTQLSIGLSQCRNEKNRVISKAMLPAWFLSYYALHGPFHRATVARWFSYSNSTTETSSTLCYRQAMQLRQDQTKTFLVGRIFARETGRIHARSTTHRVYLQARIVREGKYPGGPCIR